MRIVILYLFAREQCMLLKFNYLKYFNEKHNNNNNIDLFNTPTEFKMLLGRVVYLETGGRLYISLITEKQSSRFDILTKYLNE